MIMRILERIFLRKERKRIEYLLKDMSQNGVGDMSKIATTETDFTKEGE